MKKHQVFSLAFILVSFPILQLFSQFPEDWYNSYSKFPAPSASVNFDVLIANDGMIYVAGYTADANSPAYHLIKCKPNGDTVWTLSIPDNGSFFSGGLYNTPIGLAMDSQGGLYFASSEMDSNNFADIAVRKIDTAGAIFWSQKFGSGDSSSQCFRDLTVDFGDNLIVLANEDTTNTFASFVTSVYHISPAASLNWKYFDDDESNFSDVAGEVKVGNSGRIYFSLFDFGVLFSDSGFFELIAIDTSGNVIFEADFRLDTIWDMEPPALFIDPMENLFLSAFNTFGGVFPPAHRNYTAKFDSSGLLLWSASVTAELNTSFMTGQKKTACLGLDASGNLHVGQIVNTGVTAPRVDHIIYGSNGALLQHYVIDYNSLLPGYGQPGNSNNPVGLQFDSQFNLYISGNYKNQLNLPNSGIYTIMIDSNDQVIWYSLFNKGFGGDVRAISVDGTSVFLAGGSDANAQGIRPGYLLKYCSDCVVYIKGNVWHDADTNCVNDSSENAQAGRIVEAMPGPFYATSDSSGHYVMYLSPGNYVINEILKPGWGVHCPVAGFHSANVPAKGDVDLNNDFGNFAADTCAHLWVDIGAWGLNRCTKTTYQVDYCNYGTAPIDSVFIVVQFDSVVVPDSASVPWTSNSGYSYTWFNDTLNPGQCGKMKIWVSVSCDTAIANTTHCIEAKIYPNASCYDSAGAAWDKSSIEVTGYCENDSLACFIINNKGSNVNGNMQGSSDYRIFVNNSLAYTGSFQLAGGDSIIVCWPAQGNTIRLEADQRPGHPGKSKPNDEIELCGNPNQVKGAMNNLPQDDEDDFKAIDCKTVLGPLDPNEKLVSPAGLIGDKFVAPSTILCYQINFQNTGTDTAFKVIVKDTLPSQLNVATVQSGASSNPYKFQISGTGILQWTFENINLVDSTTNEPGSHGFVKFTVSPDTGLPIGTKIENRAGIYFDYEDVVMTAYTLSTISDTILIYLQAGENEMPGHSLSIFPNPSAGIFWISGNIELPAKGRVMDIFGRVLSRSDFTKKPMQMDMSHLTKGIYLLEMTDELGIISAGKFVID